MVQGQQDVNDQANLSSFDKTTTLDKFGRAKKIKEDQRRSYLLEFLAGQTVPAIVEDTLKAVVFLNHLLSCVLLHWSPSNNNKIKIGSPRWLKKTIIIYNKIKLT